MNEELVFELVSLSIADPPVFSLSFNVTNASPTSVSCSVNDNHFNISENDIIRTIESSEDPINVQVSVLIRMRVPGVYQCTVIADRVTQDDLVSDAVMSGNITGETGLIFDFLLFCCSCSSPKQSHIHKAWFEFD